MEEGTRSATDTEGRKKTGEIISRRGKRNKQKSNMSCEKDKKGSVGSRDRR